MGGVVAAVIAVACVGSIMPASVAGAAPLTSVGDGVDVDDVLTFRMSDDGSTLVQTLGPESSPTVRRWRAGAWTTILSPLGTYAFGISKDGNVIAGGEFVPALSAYRPVAFRNGAWSTLPAIATSQGKGLATSANSDGSVVVGQVANFDSQPVARWVADAGGAYTRDSVLFEDESVGSDVSDNGLIVVGYGIGPVSPARAYRWDAGPGGMVTNLGRPSGVPIAFDDAIVASAISGNATYIAGTYRATFNAPAQAWLHTLAGGMNLLAPQLTDASSLDVTNSGLVVAGAWVQPLGATQATGLAEYLLANGADLSGWSQLLASDVSDDGLTFAGLGVREVSPGVLRDDLWIVTIPGPGTAIVIGAALGGLIGARRRR
jgi:hypothetical protein